jgi:hypothetical protein
MIIVMKPTPVDIQFYCHRMQVLNAVWNAYEMASIIAEELHAFLESSLIPLTIRNNSDALANTDTIKIRSALGIVSLMFKCLNAIGVRIAEMARQIPMNETSSRNFI